MKKVWIFIGITLVIVILIFTVISLWYQGFKEDKKETAVIVKKIDENYKIFDEKVSQFSNLRNDFYTKKENLYYENLATEASEWNNFKSSYENAIKVLESSASYLKKHCDVTYGDIGARTKCMNFKANYEAAQNYYLTDVKVYNDLANSYNKWNLVNGSVYSTMNKLDKVVYKDYIDYDKDGEYFGKEEGELDE